ncbi:hypothetical protein Q5P01_009650 [Channa striata]|uniref:SH3 domain-containing protein n=1 Tax=Channa striata TaxID=64152 RepID=A0AA88MZ86_CHASR|nr:hypothetical protein Q5P01_009650 [Channa striata]
MTSQASFGSSMLFQTINDDLNASLATADELSREFNSMFKEVSPSNSKVQSGSQTSNIITRERQNPGLSSTSITTRESSGSSTNGTSLFTPSSQTSASFRPMDSASSGSKNASSSPMFPTSPISSAMIRKETHSPLPRSGSDSYLSGHQSPRQSPHTPRRNPPSHYDRSPQASGNYMERSTSPTPTAVSFDQPHRSSSSLLSSSKLLGPYDSQMGRRSPRPDRSASPLSFNYPASNTLNRSFGYKQPDEGVQRQKSSSKWNETDLDVSYERKPHHTYDKTEWLRPFVPNSNWRESNLDGPPPAPSPKKDPRSQSLQFSQGSLPRNTRISVPPDASSPDHSSYYSQPIISRKSIPPTTIQARQHRPIPLSVIMRLQNPYWGAMSPQPLRVLGEEGDVASYQPAVLITREFFPQPVPQPQQPPPELKQPVIYSDVLNPGDVDAELERLDYVENLPAISENPRIPEEIKETEDVEPPAPRPLSPTRLQPVVAPEAQIQQIPDREELLRIRAEIPRALKRRITNARGGIRILRPAAPRMERNLQYPSPIPAPQTSTLIPTDFRSYHSILRRSKRERKGSGNRARLSPLVLLLDGALVGELETVQRAVQEMNDPSQANDEGITALHNAICGGHYDVVDFLVRSGANVSAPDSHGWTPLHCAASCNDRALCEFLVRNGAAVMAITESDGATASQKCDPYAVGFEECESFLRGVEEAMGVENSGVLYALWSYPAQAADELSFKEGDMVTILQKPEGLDWWWASLCGREGFVPNNYFGLFPKVRPKSLC